MLMGEGGTQHKYDGGMMKSTEIRTQECFQSKQVWYLKNYPCSQSFNLEDLMIAFIITSKIFQYLLS